METVFVGYVPGVKDIDGGVYVSGLSAEKAETPSGVQLKFRTFYKRLSSCLLACQLKAGSHVALIVIEERLFFKQAEPSAQLGGVVAVTLVERGKSRKLSEKELFLYKIAALNTQRVDSLVKAA